MSELHPHKIEIPLRYAGMPHAGEDNSTVSLEGRNYTVLSGYLVPQYEQNKRDDINHRREKLVAKRVKRFFYTAEPGLDIPLTRVELAERMDEYETCPNPEMHRIKGRLLVGAMVNRMGRLAEAILHKNIDHAGIELEPAEPPYGLSDEQIAACKAEFLEYYRYLVLDATADPVRYVRNRDLSTDHDGVLMDLIREVGKPLATPEDRLQEDIRRKIGYTMEAIDEIHGLAKQITRDRAMSRALDNAYTNVVGPLYLPDDTLDTTRGSVRYEGMLQELADLCRARTGIAAEDSKNFLAVRERIDYLDCIMFKLHKELKQMSRLPGHAKLDRGEHLLWDSLELMRDMSNARLPLNHHALDIYENRLHPERDNSSAGLLKSDIEAWLGKQQGRAAS